MKQLPVLCCPPDSKPLSEAEASVLAERFKALADPARVAILSMLASGEEQCVCVINEGLDLAQPTVSHHLRILREAGLVTSTKRGTWSYYRLVPEALAGLRDALAA